MKKTLRFKLFLVPLLSLVAAVFLSVLGASSAFAAVSDWKVVGFNSKDGINFNVYVDNYSNIDSARVMMEYDGYTYSHLFTFDDSYADDEHVFFYGAQLEEGDNVVLYFYDENDPSVISNKFSFTYTPKVLIGQKAVITKPMVYDTVPNNNTASYRNASSCNESFFISGINFKPGVIVKLLPDVDDNRPGYTPMTTYIDDKQLTFTISKCLPMDYYRIYIKNIDGTYYLDDIFTFSIRPYISSISPSSAKKGDLVTISGYNFTDPYSNKPSEFPKINVEFNGTKIDASSVIVLNDEKIRFIWPDDSNVGQYDFRLLFDLNISDSTDVYSNAYSFTEASTTGPSVVGSCFNILGKGTYVPFSGVNNSGKVWFAPLNSSNVVPVQYRACVVDPNNDGVGPFELRGWAWNDNLGYISFYCNAGQNLGASCGSTNYTVTVDDNGKFDGWAFGDNIGKIYFNDTDTSHPSKWFQVAVNVENPLCEGYIYSPNKPYKWGTIDADLTFLTSPLQSTCNDFSGDNGRIWAWTDSVGWFNFEGVVIPWYQLHQEIDANGVTVEFYKKRGGENEVKLDQAGVASLTKANAPVADSKDYYRIGVVVKDKSGKLVDPGRFTVSAVPVWASDTVYKDQTTPGNHTDNKDCSDNSGNLFAVKKPCVVTAGNDKITSVAPTTNMNGQMLGGKWFSYGSFTTPSNMTVSNNQLALHGVNVTIKDNMYTPIAKALGNNIDCVKLVSAGGACDPLFVPVGGDLKFAPQTEVTDLNVNGTDSDLLEMTTTKDPVSVTTAMIGPGKVTFNAGIDGSSGSGYSFGFASGPDLKEVSHTSDFSSTLKMLLSAAGEGLNQYISGLYIYSTVDEGSGVKYYSNKLPRKVGSMGVQPVAILRGNVYSNGATTSTKSTDVIRSLGDVSTNILRDTIYRNVTNIIGGKNIVVGNNPVRICTNSPCTINFNNMDNVFMDGKVLYVKGTDVYFETATNPIFFTGEKTIIVEGGNVYIGGGLTKLIKNPSSAEKNNKLGIIVLKDLSTGKGGNVYIGDSVTNIQANIFADGTVFPYTGSASSNSANSKGEPVNLDEKGLSNNQLYIEGSLSSQNTIGGAAKGDGNCINGKGQKTDCETAKLYDLNYLRRYTGVYKKDSSGNVLIGPDPGTPVNSDSEIQSLLLDGQGKPRCYKDGGVLVKDTSKGSFAEGLGECDLGSTYIYFDPPTATLPGFGTNLDINVKQNPSG